uniref:Uncharacterized protein n=1 Tax=Manihot esculenta TaxID=3983 RepID=A0A2C9VZL7_MANES
MEWRATTDADDCVEAAKRLFLHATHQKAKKMSTTQRSKYWERGFGLEAREIEKTLGENYKSTSDRDMSTTQRSKYRERGFGLEAREIEKTLGENYKSTSD